MIGYFNMSVFDKNMAEQPVHPFRNLSFLVGQAMTTSIEELFAKHTIDYWRTHPNTFAHELFHIVSGGRDPQYYEYDDNDPIHSSTEPFMRNIDMVSNVMKEILPFINRTDGCYQLKVNTKTIRTDQYKYECVAYLDFDYFYYEENGTGTLSESELTNTVYYVPI